MFAHLQREFPGIACVKCSCHLMHLVACKATLKLPKAVEDLIRNLDRISVEVMEDSKITKNFKNFFTSRFTKYYPQQIQDGSP